MNEPISKKDARRQQRSQAQLESRLAAGGLTISDQDERLIHLTPPDTANALRFFLTRLQHNRADEFPQTLALTAALAGEGVSFVARSLASIIAHDLDRSVCLVETNWWDPPVDSPATERHATLADVIRGSCQLDDAVMATSDPRLSILPAGQMFLAERSAAVVGPAFADALKFVAKTHDTVILDLPPLLKTSEATTIASYADAVVVVVRHGVTTERQITMAFEMLESQNALGIILNRTRTRVPHLFRRFTVPI